jgi:hypothetical protein
MKLTKSQLKAIIREEIQKLKQPKMSTRLKELIESGWVLSEDEETVKNPVTGRTIKVKTALSYPTRHPAYKAVMQKRQDAEDAQADRQAKKDATQAVSAMRGKVSATTKNDKILSKFVNNSDAIDKLSPKSKEKLYKLVDTRIKLAQRLDDKAGEEMLNLEDKYGGKDYLYADIDTGMDRGERYGPPTAKIGKRTLKGDSVEKYQEFMASPEATKAKDVSPHLDSFDRAYRNAVWTLKNPKMGVMKPEEAQSIVDEFEKVSKSVKLATEKGSMAGNLRKIRDHLDQDLWDDNKGDSGSKFKGTRYDDRYASPSASRNTDRYGKPEKETWFT